MLACRTGMRRCAPKKSPGTTKVDELVECCRSSVGRVRNPIGSYTSLIERKRIEAEVDAGCDIAAAATLGFGQSFVARERSESGPGKLTQKAIHYVCDTPALENCSHVRSRTLFKLYTQH
jgi:hypothetical protein